MRITNEDERHFYEIEVWEESIIVENFALDRTSLILKFVKKQAIKTYKNKEKIRIYLQKHELAKASAIAELLDLSVARTRAVFSEMDDVEALGTNRARRYRLRKKRDCCKRF